MRSPLETVNLQERKRQAVHDQLARIALGLYLQRGFSATTIDDIVHEAGISRRSYFRYFKSKEEPVFDDMEAYSRQIVDRLLSQPPTLDVWEALRIALREQPQHDFHIADHLTRMKLVLSTPELQAGFFELIERKRMLICLTVRQHWTDVDAYQADVLASAATAISHTAWSRWAKAEGTEAFGPLVDLAFASLRPTGTP